ncbi:MAG: hypothetical protein COA79_21180 [Planctomycetota bacterium]|nr:MAG: hypothetical protein COA79_21180 [Planctomycetota bacterium]
MKYLLIPLLALIVSCGSYGNQFEETMRLEKIKQKKAIEKLFKERQQANEEQMKKEEAQNETPQKDDTEK